MQSVPDLQRILEMSKLFGVSTDYLLKDDLEEEENVTNMDAEEAVPVRKVSMEEANKFLSIVPFMLVAVMSELNMIPVSENVAAGIGYTVMFVLIAIAVVIFILCGMQTKDYEYLENERIETEYGVYAVFVSGNRGNVLD